MTESHRDPSGLRREVVPMPDDVLAELTEEGLLDDYRARPAYQQNDYLGWIDRAKRPQTREKGCTAEQRPQGAARADQKSSMPPPGMAGALSSGLSTMTASVVRNSAAMEPAFCSADSVTLAASMTPASTRFS